MKLLYVEDNEADVELLKRALDRSPRKFDIEVAANLAEARTCLQETQYELALIDLRLPDGSGIELLAEIRQNDLPLATVIFTGQGDEESAIAALKAGANDYMIKNDYYFRQAARVLENALDRFQLFAKSGFSSITVLYIVSDAADVDLTRRHLARYAPHIRMQVEQSSDKIFDLISTGNIEKLCDICLIDYRLPGLSALELLKALQQNRDITVPAVLVTDQGDEETALQALRLGASDYLVKQPGYLFQLPAALENAYNQACLAREHARLLKSEERFRVAIRNSQITVAHVDRDLRYTWIHSPHPDFDPSAVIGKRDDDLSDNAGTRKLMALKKKAIETGAAQREEISFPVSDGIHIYDISAEPLKDKQGGIIGATTSAIDITERVEMEHVLKRRLGELEALYSVSSSLRSAETVEEMLSMLLDETLKAFETNVGAILLYDDDRKLLRHLVTRGWFRELQDISLKQGEGITGMVFNTGEPYVSEEFSTDQNFKYPDRVPEGWGGASIPINVDRQIIGTLTLAVPLPRKITPDNLKLLLSLGDMAGTAVHRITLHEEAVKRLQKMQATRAIDASIIASQDMSLTLDILLEHLVSQLSIDAAGVFLLNQDLKVLEFAAGKGFRSKSLEKFSLDLQESMAGRAVRKRQTIHVYDINDLPNKEGLFQWLKGDQFSGYICIPLSVKGEVKGVLEIFGKRPFRKESDWLDFLESLALQAAITINNNQLFEDIQRANLELTLAYDATLEGWSRALELRDHETDNHSRRVTDMTMKIAEAAGVSASERVHIRRGALLHDIGKVGVPDSILHKPDKLNAEEWAMMKKHPVFAYQLLSPIEYLRPALDIPYCHHEKWDGSGYPRGLRDSEIPLAARIFAVADVFDALTSERPYRPAWDRKEALKCIREESGKHFDPRIVEIFFSLVEKGDV